MDLPEGSGQAYAVGPEENQTESSAVDALSGGAQGTPTPSQSSTDEEEKDYRYYERKKREKKFKAEVRTCASL